MTCHCVWFVLIQFDGDWEKVIITNACTCILLEFYFDLFINDNILLLLYTDILFKKDPVLIFE